MFSTPFNTEAGATPTMRAVWLSHHHPDQLERCVVIGGRPVCRRCLFLWPLTFVALCLSFAGVRWPRSADDLFLVVLPLPAVAEFVLEHAGRWPYRRRLQALVSVPLAAALGVGFDRYLHHPGDGLWWSVVGVYGAVCLGAAVLANRRALARR
jgi:hypothetical protein